MRKEFYTEKDIEDMVKNGTLTLRIHDGVVLTDLAYEKANRLGLQLLRDKPENPPSAPVRPYITQPPDEQPAASSPVESSRPAGSGNITPPQADGAELHQRIRNAVIGRLGSQVDASLLDVIIQRVMQSTGLR